MSTVIEGKIYRVYSPAGDYEVVIVGGQARRITDGRRVSLTGCYYRARKINIKEIPKEAFEKIVGSWDPNAKEVALTMRTTKDEVKEEKDEKAEKEEKGKKGEEKNEEDVEKN